MSDSWGLAQYTVGGSAPTTGFLVDGILYRAPESIAARPILDLLHDWQSHEHLLRRTDPTAGTPVSDARLIAPITYPGKVLCAGANYYSHAEEMGTARPDPDAEPFFFLKPPTTTVVGDGATVAYPGGAGDAQLDWEAELVVVIGRPARDIAAAEADDHIAGYTIANDLSARAAFARPNAVMAPFAFDWLAHKGQDGFCPLGPAIVPAWLVPDPQDLQVSLDVSGTTKQDCSTADMVIGVRRLVAAASRLMTLEPGDIILTGTPAGVGVPRNEYLHAGDVVTVSIAGIGVLTTTIGRPLTSAPSSSDPTVAAVLPPGTGDRAGADHRRDYP